MANQIRPKVVMQMELRMGATDRIREVADVIIDPTFEAAIGADVIVPGSIRVDAALLDRVGPNLKLVAKPGIGVDSVDIPACTAHQVLLVNTPDAPTESTAEHAVALLMAVAKRVMVGDMYLRSDRTIPRAEMIGTELLGSTLGVVGYGRIGRRVAEICALGLRMNVLVYDPYISLDQPTPERVTLTDNLDGLLRQSQFVTVHVPLTPNTRHYIGEREMRLMAPGSYLVNASRGPVVDEAALIRLLQEGHFAAVGLDVFDPEPPHPDNPLLQMRNVVVTPHIASSTDRGIHAMMHGVADQVIQVLNRERPPHLLNPEVWPGRVLG
ncbi:MAG: hydroxyacid dehydrogenase [Caldilineaceae bacterium]|nr:hydroxyacid dehydrogenase [Caldilineaceae bacterium]